MRIIGDVEGRDVLLVDDIVDTAGTITKAADLMMQNGAKSVRAMASHAVMSDPATMRIDQSSLKEMIFTDSIPYTQRCAKIKQLSMRTKPRPNRISYPPVEPSTIRLHTTSAIADMSELTMAIRE